MRRGKAVPKRSKKAGDSKSINEYFKQRKSGTNNIRCRNSDEQIIESGDENKSNPPKGFFACYLLTSLSPRHKGHTYIGFTVNPRRRIRQHNGEIGSGAWRTKSKRPWEMVLCIHGFPTSVSALQFEWAWQHPQGSVTVRQSAATFKSFSGVANKIKLAYTMLTLPAWQSLNITVNYFSTKYTNHSACCPSLPEQMKVKVCSMDELPCYTGPDESVCEDDFDNLDEHEEVGHTYETASETYPNEGVTVSADNLHSVIHESSHEQFEHIEENGTRKLGESSGLGVHNVESLVSTDSLTSKATSVEAAECAATSTAGKESLRGMWFTYAVEADEDPPPWVKEKLSTTDNEKRGDSSTSGVYHTQSFDFICSSPVRTSFSIVPSLSSGETAEGTDTSIIEKESRVQKELSALVGGNGDQQPWTREKPLTTEVEVEVVKDQVPSSDFAREVEVIDLLTPSPSYRVRPCIKRRRISKFSPEIIDLT
ncbi:putative Methyltransferase-related protein [Hibiscus syriacus]|uniref:Structure-specific endonuclease subunit SLX1 homolog n=1 Tax=Hibiscus syriacus TaxID=106335 RepID=A0A6A2YTN8_HIBSY|nr:uncharacterized protein LOC120157329 [Hibiscus syriacus]KAE8682402.1 putative Methyltransferase-related protein [Hibiscus syriacus]